MGLFDESEEEKPFRAKNNGQDKRKNPKVPEARKRIKKSTRKALKADDFYMHDEERDIAIDCYNESRATLVNKYGEFTNFMEYQVIALGYALVRMRRKARLESYLNQFTDRIAPHDPINQVISIVKALGMVPDKKEQEQAEANQELKKLLQLESEDGESKELGSQEVDYQTWLQSREVPALQMRTPATLPRYDDEPLKPDDLSEDADSKDVVDFEKINNSDTEQAD